MTEITFKRGEEYISYCYTCVICKKDIPIYSSRDSKEICPECARRLKKLLYPEEKDD